MELRNKVLNELIEVANKHYDGHFTLLKFTTSWKCCLGTLLDINDSHYMAEGETMEDAIINCLENDLNFLDIQKTSILEQEKAKKEYQEYKRKK